MKKQASTGMPFKGASHYADKAIGFDGFVDILKTIKAATKGSNVYMGFYAMGGEILNPKREISYPHREALYMLDVFSKFRSPETEELYRTNFNSLYDGIDPHFSGRSYVNYPSLDFPDTWANRYYGESLDRLADVKLNYDLENLFDFGAHSLSAYNRS